MNLYKRNFLSFLTEADIEDDETLDDVEAMAGELDDPENMDMFNSPDPVGAETDGMSGSEEVIEPNLDYHKDLSTLRQWTQDIDEMLEYFNGGIDSVLGKLKEETKVGTIFDGVSDATKSDILDITERLASLNQVLKNLYTEKHK